MNPLDILYYTLAIGFAVLVGLIAYLVYHVVKTLRSVKKLVDDSDSVAAGLRGVKDKVRDIRSVFPVVLGAAGFLGRRLLRRIF